MWFFFFNDTATTEIYTLSLHDALPISIQGRGNLAEAERCYREILADARIAAERDAEAQAEHGLGRRCCCEVSRQQRRRTRGAHRSCTRTSQPSCGHSLTSGSCCSR